MMADWIWLVPPFVVAYGTSLCYPRWGGYGTDELKRLAMSARVDPVGMLALFLLTRCLSSLCSASAAGGDGNLTIEDASVAIEEVAERRVVPTAVAWFFGMFPLFFHMNASPLSEKNWDLRSWAVGSKLGLWVYLTRWIIFTQFMYLSMCLYAEMAGGPFRVEMYSATTNIASCCVFMSVQYYTLVHPHKHTDVIRQKWNKRGVPFNMLQAVTHAPSIIIAFADIILVKDRELLVATRPTLLNMAAVSVTFCGAYVVTLLFNYAITGQWPYRFMDDLMTSPGNIAAFFVKQVGIFYVFLAVVLAVELVVL
mmetsp:Transcript_33770/g.88739  ORF Transcript_33770/g.88739 Transcript_33770/m.88739 type:complete len:310 (+) Transcript_33770:52-981(+)